MNAKGALWVRAHRVQEASALDGLKRAFWVLNGGGLVRAGGLRLYGALLGVHHVHHRVGVARGHLRLTSPPNRQPNPLRKQARKERTNDARDNDKSSDASMEVQSR
jgi:hypothetical protein